jgi:cytochrome c oxidase cbb3-type subunit 3
VRTRFLALIAALAFLSLSHPLTLSLSSQTPSPQPRPGVGYADRPKVDATAADRGRRVWAAECITCHGAIARGTDNGPNLIRSPIVLRDRYGSELGPFLKKGHPAQTSASSTSLTEQQAVDLTHFLRQRIEDTLRGSVAFVPQDILVGNAAAGAQYFAGAGKCASCHSVTGDLAKVATRIPAPVDLQQRMLFPTGRGRGLGANAAAITVTITPASGAPMSGTLVQMDDFYISFRDASGTLRVVKRLPTMKVTKVDPLQAHRDLLRTIADRNIHDLVAYLVTLK